MCSTEAQIDPTHESADSLRDLVINALRTVYDPEIPINIHELGLIYDLAIDESKNVAIKMTLTTPNCPMAEQIVQQVKSRVGAVAGVRNVDLALVWEPAWTPDRMSEAAKLELEFTGHTGPAHLRKDRFTSVTIGKRDRPRS
jgi:FeS assembly SUF system protein